MILFLFFEKMEVFYSFLDLVYVPHKKCEDDHDHCGMT